MAFSDRPIVDENSKASEESVLAAKGHFSRRNGFISREEIPDYGCDLDVEIIMPDSSASSKKFPIQIKSGKNLKRVAIDGIPYISLSFLTSRLRYLCDRSPAYGLVILYDDNDKACFYEYVEKIIDRLNNEKGIEEWKNNTTVTIHVPEINVISDKSIVSIREAFLARFKAHDELLHTHGKEYNIPSFLSEEYNTENKLSPIQLLQKYGLLMLDDYNIAPLYELLKSSSNQDILSSKELTLIACVVYSEMGMCIEAEYYFKRSQTQNWKFENWENDILKFSHIKIDFLLGKRTTEDYYNDLKQLSNESTNIHNKLQLKINLFYYSVVSQIRANEIDESGEKDMIELFTTIDNSDLPVDKKWLLKIYQAENLNMYINTWMMKKISSFRISDSLKENIPQEERDYVVVKGNNIIEFVIKIVLEGLEYGKENSDDKVQAHAYYALGRFYLIKEFDFLLLHHRNDDQNLDANFRRSFQQSLNSYNLFLKINILQDARLALINARDLCYLARFYYNLEISNLKEEEEIINRIKMLENEMGVEPDVSKIEEVYKTYLRHQSFDNKAELAKMTDDEIYYFSVRILNIYKLPDDRLTNIINELKAYRLFYLNSNDDRFELQVHLDHLKLPDTKYRLPSKFIIFDKIIGIGSSPDSNVENLMRLFNIIRT